MKSEKILSAALALRNARDSRITIPRISETFGISGMEEAYLVSSLNIEHKIAKGGRIVGKKIGLTSKAVQAQLGVGQPDFGILFMDMEYLDGAEIPDKILTQPKAEAEIAFVIGSELKGEEVSYSQFLSSIKYVVPAIEIVDSVIDNWKITLEDTIADNASSGVYVLGNQPFTLGNILLGDVKMSMTKNDIVVSEGTGADCLGHPLRAAYWLAKTMLSKGESIKSGEVVLSGALGPMTPLFPGDRITSSISGLGTVSCSLAKRID